MSKKAWKIALIWWYLARKGLGRPNFQGMLLKLSKFWYFSMNLYFSCENNLASVAHAVTPHCNGYAKKCPQKPKFDGHRFDFLSIIPKVYYSFEHIMLKSSIVFNENVQKFDLHDSNFEPNWMKSTKLLYSL